MSLLNMGWNAELEALFLTVEQQFCTVLNLKVISIISISAHTQVSFFSEEYPRIFWTAERTDCGEGKMRVKGHYVNIL